MQRLKTPAQFEAVMAGGATVSRTAHFALHRAAFGPPAAQAAGALFREQAEPWIGVIVPKRWARRAVTRNAIKRQIYTVSLHFEDRLPAAAHVVRLRAGFDKVQYPSATSPALRQAVRAELQQLFAGAGR